MLGLHKGNDEIGDQCCNEIYKQNRDNEEKKVYKLSVKHLRIILFETDSWFGWYS